MFIYGLDIVIDICMIHFDAIYMAIYGGKSAYS